METAHANSISIYNVSGRKTTSPGGGGSERVEGGEAEEHSRRTGELKWQEEAFLKEEMERGSAQKCELRSLEGTVSTSLG